MHVPDGRPSKAARMLDKLRAEEARAAATTGGYVLYSGTRNELCELIAVQQLYIASLESQVKITNEIACLQRQLHATHRSA